jgi:hypothetical protein
MQTLLDAIKYRGVVSGYTHDFYRYPARFSPLFARAAIELFSKPGDTVLDPFMGGSTTLVESLAAGRNAVGLDISELAVFLARVKTAILSQKDRDALLEWAAVTAPLLSPFQPVERHNDWHEAGYQRNLPWRFRKAAEQGLNLTEKLPPRLREVARCIVLRTIQWAADGKKHFPKMSEVREQLIHFAVAATQGLEELAGNVKESGIRATIEAFHAAAETITAVPSALLKDSPPKLVVTSPPYPGVHVLYHRWQTWGGKESPAPFWIADCLDGQGCAYYTFGDRRTHTQEDDYFRRLRHAFAEVRKVVAEKAVVVQLVGFAKPQEYLPRYLEAMEAAGFQEYEADQEGAQFWRPVPNRKWYTWLRPEAKQAAEVMLIHRATGRIPPSAASGSSPRG